MAVGDILTRARPFLRGELGSVDEELPTFVEVLASAGAGECWHKHGDFLHHLLDVYRILHLWGAHPHVSRCGLFHSAYSNSYVNLAIFPPDVGRPDVRRIIGGPAEHLVHLFCIVPRQPLIHDKLLFRYTDAELVQDLADSQASVEASSKPTPVASDNHLPEWRRKLQALLPAEGITVKHIRTGENVLVPRRLVAIFLLMTMADFSDQLFGFQDVLFDNTNGRMEFTGNSFTALWPGNGKPGLWMNSISRMGALYNLIAREEILYIMERDRKDGGCDHHRANGRIGNDAEHRGTENSDENGDLGNGYFSERMEEIELVIPPVFDDCTKVLDQHEQIKARDLYWEAVSGVGEANETAAELLIRCCEKNPFVGEPHVVLAQTYLSMGRYEEGEREAEVGLRLMLEWGSSWDKRMSWEGWISWARVLAMKAKERSWPEASWGILNLGLVK
ncbi:hypothetical protein EJ110_NYTH36938 [Nymphaea thermarum]|nr:hypothetical protein EJ110_NYTH36938 [Nymphaea thermarum]